MVTNRFPNDKNAPYIAVNGFLFLRFFAPAVLGPKLFKLLEDYSDARNRRTFTLLAKTLQNLANLVEFGNKEEYMVKMNNLIHSNIPKMINYVDNLTVINLFDQE